MNTKSLLGSINFYILLVSGIIAAIIFIWVKLSIQIPTSQAIKLDQIYALLGVTFLYLTIITYPLTEIFTNLPFKVTYLKQQKTLAISAFLFAFLHSYFAFFGELGGFAGLGFLSDKYLAAIILAGIALFMLFVIVVLSLGFLISKINFSSKIVRRVFYMIGFLVLTHALLLGTHFTDLSAKIPQVFFVALTMLFSLEAIRLDRYLRSKFSNLPRFSISFGIFLILVTGFGVIMFGPFDKSSLPAINVHSVHIQIAKQAQLGATNLPNINPSLLNLPGLQGDRTRRFTVSFNNPTNVELNQDTNLTFQVFDASSGNQVQLFQRVYEKPMHLIIVDSQLQYFSHIHPEQNDQNFSIITQFPLPGIYHLYTDFQPLGATEQQFAHTLNVGNVQKPTSSSALPDNNLTKTFGEYEVTLEYTSPLKASELSVGNQKLIFTIKNASTHQPITSLRPYLAAFGHLVMIEQNTFDYIHVHPTNLFAPDANARGGPVVEFLPLGFYGPIKPGIYRIFAQFNPDNNLFTADFTVKVE